MKHRIGAGFLACLLSASALAQVTFDFEDQQIPAGWSQPPDATGSWAVSSTHAASGAYSLRSAPIGHSERAAIRWNIGFLPGDVLSFKVRTESESCCDTFQLLIDNQVVHTRSGFDTNWHEIRKSAPPGNHVIEFRYSKDSSAVSGLDSAWVDDVRVGQAQPVADPLFQQPGVLAVSLQGQLQEARIDGVALRTVASDYSGPMAFAPSGDLYIAERGYSANGSKLVRFSPAFEVFGIVNGALSLQSLAALDDRLIGGRVYDCGAYSSVFYATGNVFSSTRPDPCEQEWVAISRQGATLFVAQGNRISRRAVASPGTVMSQFTRAYAPGDIAAAPDGTLWTLEGQSVVHLAADGSELSRTAYPSQSLQFLAVREDGLLALGGSYALGFVQPEHGYATWRAFNGYPADIAFRPGVVADQDGDTLPLWWEQAYGLDPASAADAALDSDSDGLTNVQEFLFRSAPRSPDTDNDGAGDAVEHAAQSNPQRADTDGDGLSDGIEIVDLGSNPNSIDSDGDGMGDYYEFTHGLDVTGDDRLLDGDGDGLGNFDEFQRGTNPAHADSDGDGLGDGAEVATHHTDPLDADCDDDGLPDGAEVATHHTDPLDADSDGDGLDDELEVVTLRSNPNQADTDADGMPDGWEHGHALNVLVNDAAFDHDSDGLANLAEFTARTDPRDEDSDNDQYGDGAELAAGSDPTDPDTDDDRLPDGWEVAAGYDPLVSDAARDTDGDRFTALQEFWWGSLEGDATSRPVPLPWSTHQGNPRHNGYQPLFYRLDRGVRPVLSVTGVQAFRSVAGGGRIFYTQNSYFDVNRLVAIDAVTGAELWRQEFGNVRATSPPALYDGIVYVQTARSTSGQPYLHAYHAATGEAVFKSVFEAQWEQYLAPTVYGDYVYINGGTYGGAYAFHRLTGARQWYTALNQWDQWTPAVDASRVYAYTGGFLDILDRATGIVQATVADPLFSWNGYSVGMAPVLGGYGNVIVCSSGHVTVFDTLEPAVAWTRNGCGVAQPAAANGLVFMLDDHDLLALNEIDGSRAWSKVFAGPLRDNLIITPDHAIVSDSTQTHFVRLSDRRVVASVPTTGEKSLTEDGQLVITNDGRIAVYQLDVVDPAVTIFFDSFD